MKSLTQKQQIEILAEKQCISKLEAERRYHQVFSIIYEEMMKKEAGRIVTPIGTFNLNTIKRKVKISPKWAKDGEQKQYNIETTKYRFNIADKLIDKNTKEIKYGE